MIRGGLSRGLGRSGKLTLPLIFSVPQARDAIHALWTGVFGKELVEVGGDILPGGTISSSAGDPWTRTFLLMGG